MSIGWVSVDWLRRCKTHQSLRELDNQGCRFFRSCFFGDGGRDRSFICTGWKTLTPHKGNGRMTSVSYTHLTLPTIYSV